MRRTTLALLAVAGLAAGCSGSSDESLETPSTESASAVTDAPTDDTAADVPPSDDTTPADTPAETSAATEPPSTEAPAPTSPPLIEAAETFELLTGPAETGTQPELVWEAVDGASSYRLVVLDGEGLPYWAWSGEDTSVFLGGGGSSDGLGPSVGAGFTWSVTAFDADDVFVAASPLAPLAI